MSTACSDLQAEKKRLLQPCIFLLQDLNSEQHAHDHDHALNWLCGARLNAAYVPSDFAAASDFTHLHKRISPMTINWQVSGVLPFQMRQKVPPPLPPPPLPLSPPCLLTYELDVAMWAAMGLLQVALQSYNLLLSMAILPPPFPHALLCRGAFTSALATYP